jgi:transcriptional regulator with XRE-family HTH domain
VPTTKMRMSFGETLRGLRQQAGLTQTALAEKAVLSLRSVQNWEQGHRIPRVDTLLALAKALQVSVDRLLAKADARELLPKENSKPVKQETEHRQRPRRRGR